MTNLAENLATTTSQGDLARELQRLRDAEGVTFAAIANKTVSYTHLDVYKRQDIGRQLFLPAALGTHQFK